MPLLTCKMYGLLIHTLQSFYIYICISYVAANNFALGGLADWYATFLLRYTSKSIDKIRAGFIYALKS